MIPINYVFAFFGLLIGSVFDIKSREVPDWLNFSMVGLGFGTAVIASIQFAQWSFIVSSIIGFAVAFIMAMIFYKVGQWGGGDAKALMGLGALIGIDINGGFPIFVILILNIFVIGAFYGSLWSVVLALKHRQKFKKEFIKLVHSKRVMFYRKILFALTVFGLIMLFSFTPLYLKPLVLGLTALIFFSFYFYLYSKAVEKSSMEKQVSLDQITEGDWVLDKVIVKNKVIYSPNKEGIEQKDIDRLLKLKDKGFKVRIKEGIPFLPSFFLAFILLLLLGNWLMILF